MLRQVVKSKKKRKVRLISNPSGSFLRLQTRAMTIGHSPKGTEIS